MSRLRLQAGCCMLKLAQEPIFADAIRLEQFETMALLVNVSYFTSDDICFSLNVCESTKLVDLKIDRLYVFILLVNLLCSR